MKKILLLILAIAAMKCVSAQVIDTTLQSPAIYPGNVEFIPESGGGYLVGTGAGSEFYQKYSLSDYAAIYGLTFGDTTYISSVTVMYGKRTLGPNPGYIKARVYNVVYNAYANLNQISGQLIPTPAYGPDTTGALGTSDSVNMASLPAATSTFVEYTLNFPTPVKITQDSFFVSIVVSNAPGDSLAIASSIPGGPSSPPFPFSSWYSYGVGSSNLYYDYNFVFNNETTTLKGDDIDLGIFPTVGGPICALSVTDSSTNTLCGQNNGIINLYVSGATPPVSYLWSNGATTQNIGSLGQGVYTVTVTDDSCSQTLSVTIYNTNGPVITDSITDINCSNLTGSIAVSVTGGTPPYTYSWSNGATTQNIDSLYASTYSLTVTDVSGCAGYTSASVNYDVPYQFFVYASGAAANCNASNGTLTAQAYGGNPPYTYLWGNGQTAITDTGLAGGSYTITATDANGCSTVGYGYVYSQCYNIIEGKIFDDVNGNCTYGAGDTPMPYIGIIASDSMGDTYYGYTDSSGNYYIQVYNDGTFTLTPYLYSYGVCGNITPCGNPSATVTFNSNGDSSLNNNFGFQGSSGFDLTMHPGWTSAKPGFPKQYWVMPYNQSPVPFTGTATITFYYDSHLIYDSSRAPLPTTIDTINHIITWNTTYVPSPYFDWYNGRFVTNFTVSATTPLNYNLQSEFVITPYAGDCDTANNRLIYSDPVSGSHDPNEKDVSPAGALAYEDSVLTYTIHFQNTGSDTTNFIVVKDTLSPSLNAATVVNLASSNNYTNFNISGNGILTWTFTPIYLVDSSVNAPASKGFVMFSVKKKSGVPAGSTITNSASVYFDYNTPVKTNTVSSYINYPTGIKDVSTNNSFAIFPNPSDGNVTVQLYGSDNIRQVTITDMLGQLISTTVISTGNNKTMQVQLPPTSGMYFIHLKSERGEFVGKVVKN